VKLATTKAILDALHVGVEDGNTFLQQLSIHQSWVEMMHKKVDVINHTPKALTKVSPWEAHFPETLGRATSQNVLNEKHLSILNEENESVSEHCQ
jgi:hypothetical protein